MALAQEDISFINDHLGEWLAEQSLGKPPAVYEIELLKRWAALDGTLTGLQRGKDHSGPESVAQPRT